jgi:cellulose synthase/poly-beta-1,6-N-acetylglucosamine synthase-like glycosyltransferase
MFRSPRIRYSMLQVDHCYSAKYESQDLFDTDKNIIMYIVSQTYENTYEIIYVDSDQQEDVYQTSISDGERVEDLYWSGTFNNISEIVKSKSHWIVSVFEGKVHSLPSPSFEIKEEIYVNS